MPKNNGIETFSDDNNGHAGRAATSGSAATSQVEENLTANATGLGSSASIGDDDGSDSEVEEIGEEELRIVEEYESGRLLSRSTARGLEELLALFIPRSPHRRYQHEGGRRYASSSFHHPTYSTKIYREDYEGEDRISFLLDSSNVTIRSLHLIDAFTTVQYQGDHYKNNHRKDMNSRFDSGERVVTILKNGDEGDTYTHNFDQSLDDKVVMEGRSIDKFHMAVKKMQDEWQDVIGAREWNEVVINFFKESILGLVIKNPKDVEAVKNMARDISEAIGIELPIYEIFNVDLPGARTSIRLYESSPFKNLKITPKISFNQQGQLANFPAGTNNRNINKLLISAAIQGEYLLVKSLVEEHGADVKFDDSQAFIESICRGYIDIAKYLLEKGAEVNAQSGYAIATAVRRCPSSIVKFLIDSGADIEAEDREGNNLAEIVSFTSDLDKLHILVEAGVRMTGLGFNGESLIELLVESRSYEMIRYLLEESEVAIEDDCINSMFTEVISKGGRDMITYLVENGYGKNSSVVLDAAVKHGYLDLVKHSIPDDISTDDLKQLASECNDDIKGYLESEIAARSVGTELEGAESDAVLGAISHQVH